ENEAGEQDRGEVAPPEDRAGTMMPAVADSSVHDPYAGIRRQDILLNIKRVRAGSVLIEFPASLLEIPAFRASMPMQCLKSGETDTQKLVARPFAWVDRLKDQTLSAREFSDKFARQVPTGLNERQFVDSLYPMEDLPLPFNLQMPYYLDKAHETKIEVPARVINASYGVGCEVLLPMSPTVLRWVGHVNGLCGPEYVELEKKLMVQMNRAWLNLPEKVRQRISGWFAWRGDERFLIYLPDSDFSRNDEGLAGLVLTSKRMVFCKFSRHGQHPLQEPATLHLKRDGNFAQVKLGTESGLLEMVRLRRENVEALQLLLEGIPTQLEIAEGA
ncbi:MAG: hypothetical protein R3236_06110, partial [Phycisphaeraceae bacterium]|nr:hypothetical protein [Phycisphaeraceae bacterium]